MSLQKVITGFLVLWFSTTVAAEGVQPDVRAIHADLLVKFTPKAYRPGEQKLKNHSGEVPFTGDCVDFYIAAHHQLEKFGYLPYARFLHRKKDGEGHLVACIDHKKRTYCLDPNDKRPTTLGRIHRVYRTVKISRG